MENKNAVAVFAAPIFQEYAELVCNVARELDINVHMSNIGCEIGYIGIYADCENATKKADFMKKISSTYFLTWHNM